MWMADSAKMRSSATSDCDVRLSVITPSGTEKNGVVSPANEKNRPR